jgi:hypothetical protein
MAANPTITQVAVLAANGHVEFQTKNWDVTSEAPKLLADWRAHAPSLTFCDVRYSVLQTTPERLVSTNVTKKGHLVGALTPEGHLLVAHVSDEGNYQVAYMDAARAADQMKAGGVAPKVQGKELSKTPVSLEGVPGKKVAKEKGKKSTPPKKPEKEKRKEKEKPVASPKQEKAGSLLMSLQSKKSAEPAKSPPTPPQPSTGVDPAIVQEVKDFVTWIRNPIGLGAYVDYVLNQNDVEKINKLAAVYRKIYTLFNL